MITKHGVRLLLASLSAFPAFAARPVSAQVTIDVVASEQRDGIVVPFTRVAGAAIAADGAIAFFANGTYNGGSLFLADSGAPRDLGLFGSHAIQINLDSIVWGGNQLQALSRTNLGAPPASVPCATYVCAQLVSLADNGRVVFTAQDIGPSIHVGRIVNGAVSGSITTVAKPPSFISLLDLDIDSSGALLVSGDYQKVREVYGTFRYLWPSSSYDTIFSTRDGVAAGNGGPSASRLGYLSKPFALVPEQLSDPIAGPQLRVLDPGIRTSNGVPYATLSAFGTSVLTLAASLGNSMDINESGLAMVVAQLTSGWHGLFSLDTNAATSTPVELVELDVALGPCAEKPLSLSVIGINSAGQSVVKARVQTANGVDQQLWRVTPSASFSYSFCHLVPPELRQYLHRRPIEPLPYEVELPAIKRALPINPFEPQPLPEPPFPPVRGF